MQIHTSDNPAKEAGKHLSNFINAHDGDVLCLLSGSSSLNVIEHIQINKNKTCSNFECRTIFIMGDERVSGEVEKNSYLQLRQRYPSHPIIEQLIETVPKENESAEEFAKRIELFFTEDIFKLQNLKIISLLGIGKDDGHTAGIFPMKKESFYETYRDDRTYVPVHVEGLTIDSRASLTPKWLLDHVDEMLMFAVGEPKRAILELLVNESKELHERPSELIKKHKNSHLYTDQFIEPK